MHVVQREIFECTVSGLPLAQVWEARMHKMHYDIIAPCLEDIFDEAYRDRDIVIDRLEIDIGILSEALSREEIRSRIVNSWKARISKITPGLSDIAMHAAAPGSVSTARLAPDKVDALLRFLEDGLLPWWMYSIEQLIREPLRQMTESERQRLAAVLNKSRDARLRISRLLTCDQLTSLICTPESIFSPVTITGLWQCILDNSNATTMHTGTFKVLYNLCWIEIVLFNHTYAHADGRKIGEPLIKLLQLQAFPKRREQLQALFQVPQIDVFLPLMIGKELYHTLRKEWNTNSSDSAARIAPEYDETEKNLPQDADKTSATEFIARDAQLQAEETLHSGNIEARKSGDREGILAEEWQGLFTGMAGVVLLHPFIPELLRKCNCWTDNGWRDHNSQQVALKLIVYCTHGTTEIPEASIILEKLLCDMPFEEADIGGLLSPDHENACDALLKAVIKHWSALGEISPEGLRDGFFRRDGKLSKQGSGWRVDIERKAQDILLSKIPWGLSHLHFPWLKASYVHIHWA
jgi:hypothetical protein